MGQLRSYISSFYKILFEKKSLDRFRQYGLWTRYTDLYPDSDLVYTIGTSDYSKDWFYAQVPRFESILKVSRQLKLFNAKHAENFCEISGKQVMVIIKEPPGKLSSDLRIRIRVERITCVWRLQLPIVLNCR